MHLQTRWVQIKVMSFNIRYAAAEDGANSWDRRRTLVAARVRAFDPDLLGLQECQAGEQAAYVRRNLPDYEFYGVGHHFNEADVEMAPLLFKRSVFEEARRGHFWLSETPHIAGSRSWDSWFARTAVWTELGHKLSGRSLVFLNTHFDPAPMAAEKSAVLLRRWAASETSRNPIIVTADFNLDKNGDTYSRLLDGALLVDAHRQLHPGRNADQTYHGYGKAEGDAAPLDGILASRHFRAVAADIDTYHEDELFPSDHYPLTAELEWLDDR